MSEEKVIQSATDSEPLHLNDLAGHLMQDVITGESPEDLADEFFDEFVNKNRPEAYQVLQMLDMPNDLIIQGLIDIQMQSIEVFKTNAPGYLSELRSIVESRLRAQRKN